MKRIFILFFVLQNFASQAQISPYTTMYQRNWQLINPAAISRTFYRYKFFSKTMVSGNVRAQWIGTKNAPLTSNAAIEHHLAANTRLGAVAMVDKNGAFANYAIQTNYMYAFDLRKGEKLYAGIGFGLNWQTINFDNPNNDSQDPILTDPILSQSRRNFNFSSGVFYRLTSNSNTFLANTNIDELYIGLAANNLTVIHLNPKSSSKFAFRNNKLNTEPNFSLVMGSIWGESSRDEVFEIFSIVRYLPQQTFSPFGPKTKFPVSMDLGARYFPIEKFFFGGSYGTNQMLGAEVGFNIIKGDYKSQISMQWNIPAGNRFVRLGPSVEIAASIAWQ